MKERARGRVIHRQRELTDREILEEQLVENPLTLPVPVQEKVATGEIPMRAGFEIAKLKDESAQTKMADRVIAEQLTADDAAKVVRQKRGKPTQQGRGVTETFKTARGDKIVSMSNRRASPSDVVEALQEALEQARNRAD